ncbi:MAG: histidine kinase [Tannerella sp.]|jgi:tetratricopeptide (TPR) repeat protein|nr:histidine kinase [Tannerella sp.]
MLAATACSHLPKPTPPDDGGGEVARLYEHYRDSIFRNPQAAIKAFSEAQAHAEDSAGFYLLQTYISACYHNLNDFESMRVSCRQVLDFCSREEAGGRTPPAQVEASGLNQTGVLFQQEGLLDSALVYYERAYHFFLSIDNCINLADCYMQKGNYPMSGFYFRRALFVADSLGAGDIYRYPIFSGMARLYQELDNFAFADSYYEQAAAFIGEISLPEQFLFANSRGNFYYMEKEYGKALACFRDADSLAGMLSQPLSQGIARINMGEVYILSGQSDSARFYLDSGKALLDAVVSTHAPFRFYVNGLYASLALLESNLPEAEALLLQPYDTTLINPQYIYFHNRRMQELYLRKQDFRNAWFYRSQAEAYDDSLRNIKVQNNIAEIDFRYSQDTTLLKKDIQIASSENRALQWRNASLWTLVVFLAILSAVIGIYIYRKKASELLQLRQRTLIVGLRMNVIRNRISPHFMFNALNLVMPDLRKYRELETPFRIVIQMLRDNLRASEHIAVTLSEEIGLVKNWLQYQELRNPGQIRTTWDIGTGTSMQTLLPSMSIQIPVENALKYAFFPNDADARLLIRIYTENGMLHIYIEDNGAGYNPGRPADPERGTGSGLKMLRHTIELLNSGNSNHIFFDMENIHPEAVRKGTRVILIIPLTFHFDL